MTSRTAALAVAACAAGAACGCATAWYIFYKKTNSSAKVLRAAKFSAQKHRDQRRKNITQEPYINHPLRVAELLSAIGADEDVLISALLHDTVEDTDTTLAEIEALFGEKIASIVAEVTDNKTLPKHVRKQMQIFHAPFISTEAKLVKLADKLDNLSDLLEATPLTWSPRRVEEYFLWAGKVVNGMRGTSVDLELKLDEVFRRSNEAVAIAAAQEARSAPANQASFQN